MHAYFTVAFTTFALAAAFRAHAAQTAFEALKALPKGAENTLARIEAQEGTPAPERWHILVHDARTENGLREFVVSGGQLVAAREVSQFAERLSSADIIGPQAVRVNSDQLATLAQKFAVANNVSISSMNYELRKENSIPVWRIVCLDNRGQQVGALLVSAGAGKLISRDGFPNEPSQPAEQLQLAPLATGNVTSPTPPAPTAATTATNTTPPPAAATTPTQRSEPEAKPRIAKREERLRAESPPDRNESAREEDADINREDSSTKKKKPGNASTRRPTQNPPERDAPTNPPPVAESPARAEIRDLESDTTVPVERAVAVPKKRTKSESSRRTVTSSRRARVEQPHPPPMEIASEQPLVTGPAGDVELEPFVERPRKPSVARRIMRTLLPF